MKKKINFDELIEESIKNIRDDRQDTKDLLKDLTAWAVGNATTPGNSDRHKEVGFTIAKYLEVLQRSNEQLVKLVAISKKNDSINNELSEDDRNSIFDELNNVVKTQTPTKEKKGKK